MNVCSEFRAQLSHILEYEQRINVVNVSVLLSECVVEKEVLSPATAEQRDLCDGAARVPMVAFAGAFVFWHGAWSVAVHLTVGRTEGTVVNASWWSACGKWSFSQEVVL